MFCVERILKLIDLEFNKGCKIEWRISECYYEELFG